MWSQWSSLSWCCWWARRQKSDYTSQYVCTRCSRFMLNDDVQYRAELALFNRQLTSVLAIVLAVSLLIAVRMWRRPRVWMKQSLQRLAAWSFIDRRLSRTTLRSQLRSVRWITMPAEFTALNVRRETTRLSVPKYHFRFIWYEGNTVVSEPSM